MSDGPQKNTPERENRIRERAYHLWEADGRPEGREQEYLGAGRGHRWQGGRRGIGRLSIGK